MIKRIINSIKNSVKSVLFKYLVRKEPIIVKDCETSLLKGKYALITGGNSGIGLAIAQKMIASGAKVTIVGRNETKTREVATTIGSEYIICDLGDTNGMLKCIDQYLSVHRVDILVNSAGMRDHEAWLAKTPEGFESCNEP